MIQGETRLVPDTHNHINNGWKYTPVIGIPECSRQSKYEYEHEVDDTSNPWTNYQ